MHEISLQTLARDLATREADVLFLGAPNFEMRSVFGVKAFLQSQSGHLHKIKFCMLTLQAQSGRVEPLESLKLQNVSEVQRLFIEHECSAQWHEVSYPDKDWRAALIQSIKLDSRNLTTPFDVILDLSTLPRRLILDLFDVLIRFAGDGRLNRLFCVYHWTDRYPHPRYPAEVGELRVLGSSESLPKLIENRRNVQAGVFVGFQGFDAKLFVDSLPPNKNVTVFAMINRNDPLHNLQVIRANAPVITDPTLNVSYYLTVQSGHEKLIDWAKNCIVGPDTDAYLIAPFGPKPLIISSYIAIKILKRRARQKKRSSAGFLMDLVLLSVHQYSTLYSLGYHRTSVMEFDKTELLVRDF